MMGQLPLDCDGMRELVSASLDGELSQLEDVRLQAHLSSCAPCRAYASAAAETARVMRQTPLDELPHPIVLPKRRLAVARRLQVAAAAAAVALAAGLSTTVGIVSEPSRAPGRTAATSQKLRFPEQELKMLQRASQAASTRARHARMAL
jgi:anti-sigma factor RsiW